MSKINEILTKSELQSRVAWLYYVNEDGYAGYDDIIDMIEQLRPYVELVEEMNEYSLHGILSHHGYSLFADMFKQIKEQK
jgi:hypothetical protein